MKTIRRYSFLNSPFEKREEGMRYEERCFKTIQGYFIIEMPETAKVMCVEVIEELPYIVALVDDIEGKKVNRNFCVFKTGDYIMEKNEYLTYIYMGNYQICEKGELLPKTFYLFQEDDGSQKENKVCF